VILALFRPTSQKTDTTQAFICLGGLEAQSSFILGNNVKQSSFCIFTAAKK
jgi:hypothetical protein